jgi:hypothetical protein
VRPDVTGSSTYSPVRPPHTVTRDVFVAFRAADPSLAVADMLDALHLAPGAARSRAGAAVSP